MTSRIMAQAVLFWNDLFITLVLVRVGSIPLCPGTLLMRNARILVATWVMTVMTFTIYSVVSRVFAWIRYAERTLSDSPNVLESTYG